MVTSPKVIASKFCPVCGDPYTPIRHATEGRPKGQETCSPTCARKWVGRQLRGRLLKAAVAAKKRIARERVEREVRQRFGPLTDRDIQLFNYAQQLGYTRGYNAGYAGAGRRRTTPEAA